MSLNTTVSSLVDSIFNNTIISGATLTVDAVITRNSEGVYDPALGAMTHTSEKIAVKAIHLNDMLNVATMATIRSSSLRAESLASGYETMIYVQPIAKIDRMEDLVDDTISVDGKTYTIINVDQVSFGPDKLVWMISCR